MNTEPGVTFTVKEMLDRMDRRADERHADLVRRIDRQGGDVEQLERRVSVLERDGARNAGGLEGRGRLVAAAFAVAGILVNVPVAAFYLGGHG